MEQGLTHSVQFSETPNQGLAHLQEKDRWLDHASFHDRVNERLQLLFLAYFHGVTVVDIGGREKDDCEEI